MRDRYTSVDDIAYSIESASYADLMEICSELHGMNESGCELSSPDDWASFIFSWAENRCDEIRSAEKVEELKTGT